MPMVLKDDLPLKWSPVTRWPFKANKTINFKGHKKMKKLKINRLWAVFVFTEFEYLPIVPELCARLLNVDC